MSIYITEPQLISFSVVTILGLLTWGFWRYRKLRQSNVQIKWNDAVLISFFTLALFIWLIFAIRIVPLR